MALKSSGADPSSFATTEYGGSKEWWLRLGMAARQEERLMTICEERAILFLVKEEVVGYIWM